MRSANKSEDPNFRDLFHSFKADKTMVRGIAVSCMLVLSGGCAVYEPDINYADRDYLINDGTIAEPKSRVQPGQDGYFPEYAQSFGEPANGAFAQAYLTRGLALTKVTCFTFLDEMERRANNNNYSRDQLGLTAVLASGVLAIFGAGTDTFTAAALGVAFATGSSKLFRDYYLLGPDADVVVALVKTAIDTAENEVKSRTPGTFDDAFTDLYNYSRFCATSEIRRFVREAIKSGKPDIDYLSETETALVEILRLNIARLIKDDAESPITGNQELALYWQKVVGIDSAKPAVKTAIDEFIAAGLKSLDTDAIKEKTKKIIAELKKLPAGHQENLNSEIAAEIKQLNGLADLDTLIDSGATVAKLPVTITPPMPPSTVSRPRNFTIRIK